MPPSRTRDVRVAVAIKAAPERAYQALTSARELCLFWLERAETDARSLGRLRMVWAAQGRRKDEASGVFVDLEPGRKVAWLLDARCRRGGRIPALVSVFLDPQGRGTQATVLHAGFAADDELLAFYRARWEDLLAKLKRHLEGRRVDKSRLLSLEAPVGARRTI
ncbi:MAG: SRPBCC domain-containing protein [Elusimicrobiota bacterium]|jgi:uncharacterized protein YndB with AHSA1/START domain